MTPTGRRKTAGRSLVVLVVFVYLAVTLFPLYWLLAASFKTSGEIFSLTPTWFPRKPILTNYLRVLTGEGVGVDFMYSLGNTVIVAVAITAVGVLLGGLAAYGISRSRSRWIYSLPLVFLLFSLTPPQTYAVPIFITMRSLGLFDTRLAVMAVHLTFSLPLPIWFMSQYFKGVPRELEQAAQVDGCGRLQLIFRIVFPLAAPALCTSAIFSFMHSWNEFFFASILTGRRAMTMPVAIMNFQDARVLAWDLSSAASMLAVVPLAVIVFVLQRYVVQGLTSGGVKG